MFGDGVFDYVKDRVCSEQKKNLWKVHIHVSFRTFSGSLRNQAYDFVDGQVNYISILQVSGVNTNFLAVK